MKNKYQATIGLETHVELSTKSKMFCGCPAYHYGVKPNSHTCPVCLGLPGALPVPSETAVLNTIKIGVALKCKVNSQSKFDRKQYFYPDLPKGYQISQYDEPLCTDGFLNTSKGKVRITRVHLEEDTGKLLHKKVKGKNVTLVDFNRSGVPLVEIVTEPDIHSAAQAKEFAQKLQNILRFMEVSDCDMEKGSMRLEANISLGLNLGYKVEVKNLNSFRFVERAIDYELARQEKILNQGKIPRQETRGWSEKENKTIGQRYKETEADYRYFPEPDIPPMQFSEKFISKIKRQIPKLPRDFENLFLDEYKIDPKYLILLISDKKTAEFSKQAFKIAKSKKINANDIANLIVNKKVNINKSTPAKLVDDLGRKKSSIVSDELTLESWISQAIKESPQAVKDYKSGKQQAISVLIGKVMQLSKGRAEAPKVKRILEEQLK